MGLFWLLAPVPGAPDTTLLLASLEGVEEELLQLLRDLPAHAFTVDPTTKTVQDSDVQRVLTGRQFHADLGAMRLFKGPRPRWQPTHVLAMFAPQSSEKSAGPPPGPMTVFAVGLAPATPEGARPRLAGQCWVGGV